MPSQSALFATFTTAAQNVAAVIGTPIAQSKSPVLHNLAYEFLGLDTCQNNWQYGKVEVKFETLHDFVEHVKSDTRWRGFSVTMPLKRAVFEYLDEINLLAQKTEAVNTVVIKRESDSPSTKLTGYNTDVYGIIEALGSDDRFKRLRQVDGVSCPQNTRSTVVLPNLQASMLRALILGNGATSRSAHAALTEFGIQNVQIAGRSGEFDVDIADEEVLLRAVSSADVIISALPWGGAESILPKLARQVDFTAKPMLECAFPRVLDTSIRGELMLVHQAVKQVELMTGVSLSEDARMELVPKMLYAIA